MSRPSNGSTGSGRSPPCSRREFAAWLGLTTVQAWDLNNLLFRKALCFIVRLPLRDIAVWVEKSPDLIETGFTSPRGYSRMAHAGRTHVPT
jgi:hypothetical protein